MADWVGMLGGRLTRKYRFSRFPVSLWLGLSNCLLFNINAGLAQITPDATVGTEVNTADNVSEITGGQQVEGNLFHSFQDFSVATGSTASFNNGIDIDRIIGRVTGGNISNIDGLIRANGNADLILINPNGINFGSNARLDLGGSFLASTAESISFSDGTIFSANDANLAPSLTISVPLGLQLGANSAAINLANTSGLALAPGNTLALVGNNLTFNGTTVTTPSGSIAIGSVADGEVSLTTTPGGWQLGYEAVSQFGDLQLLAGTTLFNPNSLENPTGGIQLQGQNIALERAQIIAQTLGDSPGADITINALASLSLAGMADTPGAGSQIVNNTELTSSGDGGGIEIATEQLTISDRSFITSTTFGTGRGGNVNLETGAITITGAGFAEFRDNFQQGALAGTLTPEDVGTGIFVGTATTGTAGNLAIATDSLQLSAGAIIFSPVFTEGIGGNVEIAANTIDISASAIQMGTAGTSNSSIAGNMLLDTKNLIIRDGGTIVNTTLGNADGGDIEILAESIELKNTPPSALTLTGIYANTFGGGAGGDIQIETNNLFIDEARISSNTGGGLADGTIIPTGGAGGNIDITAADTIEIIGIPSNTVSTGGMGTTSFSSADAGDITIATGKLIIREGAELASATLGSGNGGKITIDATESVTLIGTTTANGMNRGGLLATSGRQELPELIATGTSGDITLTTEELIVRDGASIDVQSVAVGDAGNLQIDAETIRLSNRASLSASTQSGRGGDITIDTTTLELDRSLINASVLGQGSGGSIQINAQDSVSIIGSGFEFVINTFVAPTIVDPQFLEGIDFSILQEGIVAATTGQGVAGTVAINTKNLEILNGGLVATATAGEGAASSIFLNAAEQINLDTSIVSASTVFNGQGGDIEINTERLSVLGGGQLTVSTLGSGNGGNLTINARESVRVSGLSPNKVLASDIVVGAQPLPVATGNGGDLTINTSQLEISDRGAISVGSIGTGDAGTLRVNADSIVLTGQGTISADTQSGKGGNLSLNTDNLILQDGSTTSATAAGESDGGNIDIDSDNVVVLENSQIVANAFVGMGGNIQIDTQGLFICEQCQITASSQLGLDGVVNIETLQPNSQLEAIDLPQQPPQSQEIVAVACSANTQANTSELIVTGRGGLPPRPQEPLSSNSTVAFSNNNRRTQSQTSDRSTALLPPPARSWYVNDRGTVVLSAQGIMASSQNSLPQTPNCPK